MRNRRSPVRLGSTILATLAAGIAMLSLGSAPLARASGTAASGKAASSTGSCTVSPILVNSCRPWLGAVANHYPQAANNEEAQLLYHEQRIGRQVDIVRSFYPVAATGLSSGDLYFGNRPNTMLDINWNPSTNWAPATVAAHNKTIDDMAKSIASLPNKVFLSIWHEPENNVTNGSDPNCPGLGKGNAGSPAQYVAMWQYVENRFAADGVTNVVWAMDYMNWQPWLCFVPDLYPGDNLVDWILFNGYGNGSPPNFVTDVNHLYAWFTANSGSAGSGHDYLSKPWGIAEWSIHGYSTAVEEKFFTSAKTALDNNTFPNLKMYNIYDSINTADSDNYRVAYDDNGTYDPTKASYYYAFAGDPHFTDAYYTPTGLSATPSALSCEIDLSWTAPSDTNNMTGYYIYRSDMGNTPIASVPLGTTSYADSSVSAGTSYTYTVAAYNDDYNTIGTSPQSSAAQALGPVACSPPQLTTTTTSTTTTAPRPPPSSARRPTGTPRRDRYNRPWRGPPSTSGAPPPCSARRAGGLAGAALVFTARPRASGASRDPGTRRRSAGVWPGRRRPAGSCRPTRCAARCRGRTPAWPGSASSSLPIPALRPRPGAGHRGIPPEGPFRGYGAPRRPGCSRGSSRRRATSCPCAPVASHRTRCGCQEGRRYCPDGDRRATPSAGL